MKMALSNPGLLSGRIGPARFSRNMGLGFSPSKFSPRALPLLGQEENGDPDPAPAPDPAPEPEPQFPPDIFVFPPRASLLACQSVSGGYNLYDAATLAFMGHSYAVPLGTFILPAGDPRCGGVPAAVAPQRVFEVEPVVSTNTLLVGGAVAAGLIVLSALI